MAANRDDSNQPRRDEENPFVAFRRFADEQISSLLQGIVGLPSAFSTPPQQWRRSFEAEDDDSEERRDACERERRRRTTWWSDADHHGRWHCRRSRHSDNSAEATDGDESVNIPVKKYTGGEAPSGARSPWETWNSNDQADDTNRNDNRRERRERANMNPFDAFLYGGGGGSSSDNDDDDNVNVNDLFSSFFSSPFFRHHHHHHHPHNMHEFHPFAPLNFSEMIPFQAAWPIGYVIFSSYSPLHLEREARLQRQRDMWRNAFEDLMFAGQGKAMPEKHEPLKDRNEGRWLTDLFERGAFGDWKRLEDASFRREQLPPAPAPAPAARDSTPNRATEPLADSQKGTIPTKPQDPNANGDNVEEEDFWPVSFFGFGRPMPGELHEHVEEENTETVTEEDLYRDFVGLSDNNEAVGSNQERSVPVPAPASAPTQTQQNHADPPNVLSTMTTTERTTLPDGRVQTRVVLKKRFADGREESSETVHTTQSSSPSSSSSGTAGPQFSEPLGNSGSVTDAAKEAVQSGKKKSGWFWSN